MKQEGKLNPVIINRKKHDITEYFQMAKPEFVKRQSFPDTKKTTRRRKKSTVEEEEIEDSYSDD